MCWCWYVCVGVFLSFACEGMFCLCVYVGVFVLVGLHCGVCVVVFVLIYLFWHICVDVFLGVLVL